MPMIWRPPLTYAGYEDDGDSYHHLAGQEPRLRVKAVGHRPDSSSTCVGFRWVTRRCQLEAPYQV